jgi:hypothetical protein
MVPTGLFIQTLNETIDDQAKRLAALRNHVPNIVQLALFGIAITASGFAGYASVTTSLKIPGALKTGPSFDGSYVCFSNRPFGVKHLLSD